jgi:hypothetical protein
MIPTSELMRDPDSLSVTSLLSANLGLPIVGRSTPTTTLFQEGPRPDEFFAQMAFAAGRLALT